MNSIETHSGRASILIVDDTPENLRVLSGMLRNNGYEVRPVTSGKLALQAVTNQPPDMILLDINMPEMNGYEVCEHIKQDEVLKGIPVIFISALSETLDKVRAFSVGGVDYITKPFQLEEVNARVATHLNLRRLTTHLEDLVQEKVGELTASQMATIMAMARLAQSRDDATGTHLERVQGYCRILAAELAQLPRYRDLIDERFIELVYEASTLHDIGKVGIPDSVLLKPGKLTSEEYEIMKQHTVIGAKTLEDVKVFYPLNEFVETGIQMARWHHERWDGTGYPDGLTREDIPLAARIMALADMYDALKSERCYKAALPHEQCYEMIMTESGTVFDPDLIDVFKKVHLKLYDIWDAQQSHSSC